MLKAKYETLIYKYEDIKCENGKRKMITKQNKIKINRNNKTNVSVY